LAGGTIVNAKKSSSGIERSANGWSEGSRRCFFEPVVIDILFGSKLTQRFEMEVLH
jgi:hypothetical protein